MAAVDTIVAALKLVNPETTNVTCVGRTRKNRRCGARLFPGNLDLCKAAIARLIVSEFTVSEVLNTLDIIAGLTLCDGQHRHQSTQVRERWLPLTIPHVIISHADPPNPSAQDAEAQAARDRKLQQKQRRRDAKAQRLHEKEAAEACRREEALIQSKKERTERVKATEEAKKCRLRDEADAARRAEALRQSAQDRVANERIKSAREAKAEADRLEQEKEIRQAAAEARRAEALRQAAQEKAERERTKREREQQERQRSHARKEEEERQKKERHERERLNREAKELLEPDAISSVEAWARYEEAWSKVQKLGANPDEASVWLLKLWPSSNGTYVKCTESGVIEMFSTGSPMVQASNRRKWLRKQALKWHPDKATRLFGGMYDKDMVMATVLMISQVVNGLMEDADV